MVVVKVAKNVFNRKVRKESHADFADSTDLIYSLSFRRRRNHTRNSTKIGDFDCDVSIAISHSSK